MHDDPARWVRYWLPETIHSVLYIGEYEKKITSLLNPKTFVTQELGPRGVQSNSLPVFDVAICCEHLQYIDDWKHMCTSVFECLRDGGLFIGTCPGEERPEEEGTRNIGMRDLAEHLKGLFQDGHIRTIRANQDLQWCVRKRNE